MPCPTSSTASRGSFPTATTRTALAIDLTAGETVTLTLAGHGDNPTPDTILTLYDADGQRLARNDDIDTDTGNYYSQLVFTPESSGTYYVSITAYTANPALDNAGGYALTVTARRRGRRD